MDVSKRVIKGKKGADKKLSRENNYNLSYEKIISYSFIILISVFIIVIPFYRGLYFRENYIPSIAYISGVFVLYILYKFKNKGYKFFNSYLDIVMLLMPVAYLISFFFSANARDAFDAVLKYAGYFMIYKITSDLCQEKIYKKAFEYVLVTAMFIMAIASLVAAFGYLDLKGVVMGNRIYGLYQYSNATASVMGAAIFMVLGFSMNSGKMYEKIFYNSVLAIVFPVFVLALSRGAYVIFAVLAILNVFLLEARKRVHYIYSMLALIASNSVFIFKYYSAEKSNESAIYLIGAVLVFLALQLLYEKLFSKLIEKIGTKTLNIILFSMLSISLIAVVLVFSIKIPVEYKIEHTNGEVKTWKSIGLQIGELMPDKKYTVQFYTRSSVESKYSYGVVIDSINESGERSKIISQFDSVDKEYELINYEFTTKEDTKNAILIFYNYEENSYTDYYDIKIMDSEGNIVKKFDKFKYLPEVLANRLTDINLKTENASLRIYFLRDGIKIIKDYFLFGAGGGGWQNLYRQYQSLSYNSEEAHNFYLQYAIETGLLGILVLLAIYCLFIRKVFISVFKYKEYSQLSIYLALLMMMGHAFMDFDLSLTALAFLFWMMIGVAGAKDRENDIMIPNNSYVRIGLLIIAVAVLYFNLSIYIGMLQGREAVSIINKDVNKSISLYESAMKKDPYNSNYHMDYMQVMYRMYKSNNDTASLGNMQKSMDKVLEMDIKDAKQKSIIVNLLLSTGKLDKAVEAADEMVKCNPMVADMYMYKLNINYEVAKYFFSNKEHRKAIPCLNNMIEAEQQFDAANSRAVKPMIKPEKMDQMINLANNWLDIAEKKK